MMRSRRRIVVDVAGQTMRAIRRVSPRAPDPARRFKRVDDDATVRRAVDWCESRGVSYGLPRSFVRSSQRRVTSHGPHARRARASSPQTWKARHRAMEWKEWNGMEWGRVKWCSLAEC